MKNAIIASAALAAGFAAAEQGCSSSVTWEGGNAYCAAVKAITYDNFGSSGNYNRVTSMDAKPCGSASQAYSGSLAPLNEDVSLHFRGPLQLKQFAFYSTGASGSSNKNKRATATERRHAHAHAHAHAHEKREAAPAPEAQVGAIVHAMIDGQMATWTNTYSGETPAPAPAANAGSSNDAPAPAAPAAAPASAVSGGSGASPVSPFKPDVTGDWVREAYYNSVNGTAQGVTFLNHFGGTGSGVFDYIFGNSLSYASTDGTTGAASPQVLADTTLPSNSEVIIMSDKECTDGSCGFSRPGTVAYKGFEGEHKTFLFEFAMPLDGKTGFNADMPAIWMLNAQIPRTLQYGDATCSCWKTGCGEFDLFEVLDSGNTKCKSTLHGNVAGGASDYFDRPTGNTIKAAVVMSSEQAVIKLLENDYEFPTTLSNSDVKALGSQNDLISSLFADLAASLFTLGS